MFKHHFTFTLINILLFYLLGLGYFNCFTLTQLGPVTATGLLLTKFYIATTYVGHLALLSILAFLPLLGLSFLKPPKIILVIFASLLGMLAGLLILIDHHIYKFYSFHLNGLILEIIRQGAMGEIFELSIREKITIALIACLLFSLEFALAYGVFIKNKFSTSKLNFIWWSAFGSLFISYLMYLMSLCIDPNADEHGASNAHAIAMQAHALPYYDNIFSTLLPSVSLGELQTQGESFFIQPSLFLHPLHYPLHPIHTRTIHGPLNIVIIGLDAWRFDLLTRAVTPNIYAFAQYAFQFHHHFSGGNATEPGLFSLFYSLPSTYWASFVKLERGPIFFHTLIQHHYDMGIFVSAETYLPPYNKTLFQEIKNLPTSTPGDYPYQRDQQITKEFKQFITRTHPPFFSFIFYNSLHGYCMPDNYPHPFTPYIQACDRINLSNDTDPLPYFNRYRNAAHFVDNEVGQLLQTLKAHHLLNNTIVIITGDHGEEFNDTHTNSWGHAGNYTHFQVQTPFIMYWPHTQPRQIEATTTHFDVVPTLMEKVLHVTNPKNDYSIGSNLFNPKQKDYLMVGSYIDFGIVERDRIVRILPGGNLSVTDTQNHPYPSHSTLSPALLRQVWQTQQRFYQHG